MEGRMTGRCACTKVPNRVDSRLRYLAGHESEGFGHTPRSGPEPFTPNFRSTGFCSPLVFSGNTPPKQRRCQAASSSNQSARRKIYGWKLIETLSDTTTSLRPGLQKWPASVVEEEEPCVLGSRAMVLARGKFHGSRPRNIFGIVWRITVMVHRHGVKIAWFA